MSDFFISFSPRPHSAHKINWLEYQIAVQKAEKEDRLIFAVISASWCHWCHILDETTLSDERVIVELNKRFICTRIDADRQPDLDIRYNQGGWPSTLILSPQAITLTGGTYFNSDELLMLMDQAENYYNTSKDEFLSKLSEFESKIDRIRSKQVKYKEPDLENIISLSIQQLILGFDNEHAGFGTEPKFPYPLNLRFMLELGVLEDRELFELPLATLNTMLEGELFDRVEGGFFRYCQNRNWTQPHTEKKLYENSLLIELLSDAAEWAKKPEFLEYAVKSCHYLLSTLRNEKGGFYSCQDADENYYSQDKEGRESMTPPPVDEEIFTGYNARASLALIKTGIYSNNKEFVSEGERALKQILSKGMSKSGLPKRWLQGTETTFHLIDACNLLNALLEAGIIMKKDIYLKKAKTLADVTIEKLYSPVKLAFLDRTPLPEDKGPMKLEYTPLDENALMAVSLSRFFSKTGNQNYLEKAKHVLSSFLESIEEYGHASGSLALAALQVKKAQTQS